jgi:DNA-binding ferritin-like protein
MNEKTAMANLRRLYEMEEDNKKDGAEVAGFIDCVMTSAVIAHKMHLKVTGLGSYAAHVALNDLYEALPGHGDDLAEKYQGYHGKLIEAYPSMDQEEHMSKSPLEFVTWLLEYVEKERGCFGTVSALQNLVDELVGDIATAKYKLTFLK